MKNLRNTLSQRKNELALAALTIAAVAPTTMAYAVDIQTSIQNVISLLMNILTGAGAVYFVIGVFNFVTSVRNEDAERQTKSTINAFIGLALIILPQVLKTILGTNKVGNYNFG